MHIAVLIKQIHNTGSTQLQPDTEASPGDFRINRLDEHALEEALRIKESMEGTVLTLISVGPHRVTEALRRGLGMGADKAIQIKADIEPLCATETAAALFPVLDDLRPDLILCGAMSEDLMQGMTGPALAAMLGITHTCQVVEKLRIEKAPHVLEVTRDAGAGMRQVVSLPFPCLVTVQQGFNTPRYPNIAHMIKARSQPVECQKAPPAAPTVTTPVTGTSPPLQRGRGLRIKGSPEEQAAHVIAYLKERQVLPE